MLSRVCVEMGVRNVLKSGTGWASGIWEVSSGEQSPEAVRVSAGERLLGTDELLDGVALGADVIAQGIVFELGLFVSAKCVSVLSRVKLADLQ